MTTKIRARVLAYGLAIAISAVVVWGSISLWTTSKNRRALADQYFDQSQILFRKAVALSREDPARETYAEEGIGYLMRANQYFIGSRRPWRRLPTEDETYRLTREKARPRPGKVP